MINRRDLLVGLAATGAVAASPASAASQRARRILLARYRFVNAEAAAYVAAMGVQPSRVRKAQIDTLVGSLKTAGVWTKLDFLYLLAAHDASAALINAKNPGTFNATAVASPTFTVDRGYAGNGTSSYLSTNFTPSTAGGQWTQDSAHWGVWSRTDANNTSGIGGRTTSTTLRSYIILNNAGTATFLMNEGNTSGTAAVTDSIGHYVTRRSGASATALFKNGVSIGTAANASTGLTSVVLFIGAINTGGAASQFVTRQFSAAHGGASLTDQNITDLFNALTAVGA